MTEMLRENRRWRLSKSFITTHFKTQESLHIP